jgi:hypothetical protein
MTPEPRYRVLCITHGVVSPRHRCKDVRPLAQLCESCGQPMLPPGEMKRPNEYDHAQGCPEDKR